MKFQVLPDAAAVAEAGADRFISAAQRAIEERGVFHVALSGGSTPRRVYPLLVREPRVSAVDWSRVELFWGDERAVPPDHPDSNFGVAYQMFVSRLAKLRREAVHRMPAEAADLDAAAAAHEREIRAVFDVEDDEVPAFDLIWLGIGPDGHTASLFPGSDALQVTDRLVVANWAPGPEAWRMTFTYPLINAGREAIFMATGADKADAIRAIREGDDLPAARVEAQATTCILDAAAAGEADAPPEAAAAR
jgi:6-phosphogluconolactonase